AVRIDSVGGAHLVAAAWGRRASEDTRRQSVRETERVVAWDDFWQHEATVALQESGGPPPLRDALLADLSEAVAWRRLDHAGTTRDPLPSEGLLRPLRAWMDQSAHLPSDQRAAALYGADIVADLGAAPFGVSFGSDSTKAYTHLLLRQAAEADSLEALSERITL